MSSLTLLPFISQNEPALSSGILSDFECSFVTLGNLPGDILPAAYGSFFDMSRKAGYHGRSRRGTLINRVQARLGEALAERQGLPERSADGVTRGKWQACEGFRVDH